MAHASHAQSVESGGSMPLTPTPLELFPHRPAFDSSDVLTLVVDFFCWLEDVWQLPVRQPGQERVKRLEFPGGDMTTLYTLREVGRIWGHTKAKVRNNFLAFGVRPVEQRADNPHGYKPEHLYHPQDFAAVISFWEWERLYAWVDACWSRFAKDPCGACPRCRHHYSVAKAALYCERNRWSLMDYRRTFKRFLQALQAHGSISACWRQEGTAFLTQNGKLVEGRSLLLIYLLDRHLLELSCDELIHLLPQRMETADYLRPWRNRRPEEYAHFMRSLEEAKYAPTTQRKTRAVLAILILLRYGLPGLAELRRPLSPDEIVQAVQEKQLLTMHLGHGVYLPFPLSDDIRVGHVILDEIRHVFWRYAATHEHQGRTMDVPGPRHWQLTSVLAIERALMTKQEPDGEAILVPRPEIEGLIHNPYTIQTWALDSSISFTLLPRAVQETILAYVRYRYQEQHCTPPTLQGDLDAIMQFFCWLCQQHAPQSDYCSWDRETLRTLVQTYLTTACAHLKVTSRYSRISKLYVFFQTLAEMGLPYPPGYTALLALRPAYPQGVRPIPREEVLDRIFREGVCHLDYDPFSRLALTIQYFCGSRITETCDLHLFCVLEDHEGHAFLLIPLGKTKQERVFPIVDVGMGPFLQFMDEVVGMQLRPDGTVRALSRANYRYLSTQPERAANWLYLFDRFRTDTYRNRGRLSYTRASDALREALILTAKVNPSGLFQEQTYSPECQMRRPRGQYCVYFASRDGITVCPMCHGPLPGRRGTRCTRRLPEDFVCDGVARSGEYFCPKCDLPLAKFIGVTTHTFRHNSVTRAHRSGVPMAQNMLLHGHQTIPMHLRYLHLGQQDAQTAVRQVMTEKHIQQLHLATPFIPGQIIEDGVASTVSLEQLLGLTLRRGLKRRTASLWGGFWAGTLAEQGTLSPVRNGQEIVLTEETYHHAVAQYRYEALGLAVSEVALEQGTGRTFQASVASFLDREKIEQLVACYLNALLHQGYLSTARGVRLVEAEIQAQRGFLNELAEMLRPWWQYLGSIERLVSELLPNVDRFQKEEGEHAH